MHFLWGVLGAPEPRLENNKLRENEAKNHKTITTKMMAVHSMSVLVFVVVVLSNSIKATEPPVPQPSAVPLPLPKFLPQPVSQSFHLSHCLPCVCLNRSVTLTFQALLVSFLLCLTLHSPFRTPFLSPLLAVSAILMCL